MSISFNANPISKGIYPCTYGVPSKKNSISEFKIEKIEVGIEYESKPAVLIKWSVVTTAKVAGVVGIVFLNITTLGAISGNLGTFFYQYGIRNDFALNEYGPRLDISLRNPLVVSVSHACFKYLGLPILPIFAFFEENTPPVIFRDQNISGLLVTCGLEEVYSRGIIQRIVLPCISKCIPNPCGQVLNHKATRIIISSAMFALLHTGHLETSAMGVWPQFTGGLLFGTVAELDESLVVPILAHTIHNYMVGGGAV